MFQFIFTIGRLFGSLVAGTITTIYGRLPAMVSLTCVLTIGSATEAMAYSIPSIAMGRFVSGVGAGAATVVCLMYIAEVSTSTKRGLSGAFSQVMIIAGILKSQVSGYFLSRGSLWRIILAFPCINFIPDTRGFVLRARDAGLACEQWQTANGKIRSTAHSQCRRRHPTRS